MTFPSGLSAEGPMLANLEWNSLHIFLLMFLLSLGSTVTISDLMSDSKGDVVSFPSCSGSLFGDYESRAVLPHGGSTEAQSRAPFLSRSL